MLSNLSYIFCFLLTLFSNGCSFSSKQDTSEIPPSFKELLIKIREQEMTPTAAEEEFRIIMADLKAKYPSNAYDSLSMDLVFPLKGKNYKSVGGRGRGFYGRHFDLFDHSIAKSHPAHDIFIYDLNRDDKDDTDNAYVDVLAVNDGVVIATESNWTEETGYKGGNYIWLYDFKSGGIWYYAHQRKVFVVEGQLVEQGDKIGEVGRTGFNAKTSRSDTHLHLMFLKLDGDFSPTPVNHYPWLKKARTVYKTQLPKHYPRKSLSAVKMDEIKLKPLEVSFKQSLGSVIASPK
ncbi:M23 family metallopeptidase [Arcticibacterium luteifluviistationis]|uniref:M23 family peptidase n=1 Tax=Arcticibacterium luteifluviistationis TaxID=1784714 RepID=A0A2Z4GAF9_9BACT|nr:M23 family metallopeptidase [Arcticibacterium luteifluviistationis]AWV97913.1 M23 family peptidase [Arcticibacterium luteifluviistationis]